MYEANQLMKMFSPDKNSVVVGGLSAAPALNESSRVYSCPGIIPLNVIVKVSPFRVTSEVVVGVVAATNVSTYVLLGLVVVNVAVVDPIVSSAGVVGERGTEAEPRYNTVTCMCLLMHTPQTRQCCAV